MSIYCGVRFKGVVLDLRDRTDIWKWLIKHKDYNYDNMQNPDSFVNDIVPKEIKDKTKIHTLPNIIYDGFENTLELAYLGNIKLDMIVSIKNNAEDELEHLVKMLQPYIVSGEIYDVYDGISNKVNYSKCFETEITSVDRIMLIFPYYDRCELTKDEIERLEDGYYFND